MRGGNREKESKERAGYSKSAKTRHPFNTLLPGDSLQLHRVSNFES